MSVIIFLSAILFFVYKNELIDLGVKEFPKIEQSLIDTGKLIENHIEKQINITTPLINKEREADSFLTEKGILKWTNFQRYEAKDLPVLARDEILDEIARNRLNDMFSKQYFEHISPQGIGASDIANEIGYEYISIGENIALGNFKDDQVLVQAWMDSPGHRANILNDRYAEIGIATKKGTYENDEVWIGVQIFALPLSACPQPNKILASTLDNLQGQITDLQNSANVFREEIKSVQPASKNQIKSYNQKVDNYNNIIRQINGLVAEQKNLISKYNDQIDLLNKCLEG